MADDFRAWRQRTQRRFLSQARSTAAPCAFFVLGEPWATGGVLAGHAAFRMAEEGGSVRISARECACLHPDFLYLLRTDPRRLVDAVSSAAEALAAEILEGAARRRFHLICEVEPSTLDAFIRSAKDLKGAGYLLHVLVGAGPPQAHHVLGELARRLRLGQDAQEVLSREAYRGWETLPGSFERLVAEMPWSTVSVHQPNGNLIEGAGGPEPEGLQRCRDALRAAIRGERSAVSAPPKDSPRPALPASHSAESPRPSRQVAPNDSGISGPRAAGGAKEFVDGSGRRVVLRGFGKAPPGTPSTQPPSSPSSGRASQGSPSIQPSARVPVEPRAPVPGKTAEENTAHPDRERPAKVSTPGSRGPVEEPPTAIDPAAVSSRSKGPARASDSATPTSPGGHPVDRPPGRREAENRGSNPGRGAGENTEATRLAADHRPAQPRGSTAKADEVRAMPDLSRLDEAQRRAVERRIKWVKQIRRIASRDD